MTEYYDQNYLTEEEEEEDNEEINPFEYDYGQLYTDQVFDSREELTNWVSTTAKRLGFVLVTRRSRKNRAGIVCKVVFVCDHHGEYTGKGLMSSRATSTKKHGCPFELEGCYREYDGWKVIVKNHNHNHSEAWGLQGHAYARRMTEAEKEYVEELYALNLPVKDILFSLKQRFPENLSIKNDIYNAIKGIKKTTEAEIGSSPMQSLLPTTPATSSQQVPPVTPSAPAAGPSSPPQSGLDELPIGLITAKTKERAWINTENQKKKQKTTTQGFISTGNPQPLRRIPHFRYRFPTSEAAEKYKVYTRNRNLLMERGFTSSESNQLELELPRTVTRVIKAHSWETFCQNPSPASIRLVREFYANYDAARPDLVYVRGKLVDASPSAINSIFSLTNHQSTLFDAVSNVSHLTMSDIVDKLTRGKVIVGEYYRPFSPYYLSKGPEIWMSFTKHNLFPCNEDGLVGKELAILLYCIMAGKPINVGKVIAKQIQKCASQSGYLWFPALITRLCEQHNVLPAFSERIQPSSRLPVDLVKRTVNYEPVWCKRYRRRNLSNQQTSQPHHDPSFPVANTVHQSRDEFGSGLNLPVPAEATENAPPHFDLYHQAPPPTAQATSSQPLPPVAPLAPPAELSCLPQTDSDKLPIHDPGLPILAEAAENAPPHFDSSQQSPPPTARMTSSQSLPPVAPSVLPAEPLSPPQTDSVELQVSSPQCGTICVQGYNVKRSVAPILEAIFKKHGDIAAECLFKTASARSYFLEVVCEVVTRIDTDNVIEKMEEIECQMSDAEAANINVSWLRAHLEAVHKRKEAMKRSDLLMETKVNTSLVKRAAQMDVRERCEELVAAQERFEKAERCARVLHLVEKNLKNAILESKAENALLLKQ